MPSGRASAALQYFARPNVFRRASPVCSQSRVGPRAPNSFVHAALDGQAGRYRLGADAARLLRDLEDNSDKLAYDLFYIKNMSIGLDLLILFKTLKIVLLGRGGR